MKGLTLLCASALALLLGAPDTAAETSGCASGSTPRFAIVNNCGADVWVVETPPGNPQTQPAVSAQWEWFKAYTTQKNPNIPGVVGLLLAQGSSQTFCVPDKGAPGGNFRFYMGCPDSNMDPFNEAGCKLGSAAGDLAGINTLFE